MSEEEKVDLIRRYAEAFNVEGFAGVANRFWEPDIVWHTDPLVPGVYTGREVVRTYLEGFTRPMGGALRLEIKDVIDLGGDDVLVVTTVSGHPLAETERETQFLDWTFIVSIRERRIVRFRSFFDKAEAFKAAGLPE